MDGILRRQEGMISLIEMAENEGMRAHSCRRDSLQNAWWPGSSQHPGGDPHVGSFGRLGWRFRVPHRSGIVRDSGGNLELLCGMTR
jgi:hypothetical protein